MKIISFFLILSIFLSCQPFLFAQTIAKYEAEIFVKKGKSADKKTVFISQEKDVLNIFGKKDKKLNKSLPFSTIKKADYSYSEKPQITEGVVIALTIGWFFGLAFMFTNKKKHWLVISTEEEAFLFELKQENYRQLIFEMNSKGIKVEDLGDRDEKPVKEKETKKSENKQ